MNDRPISSGRHLLHAFFVLLRFAGLVAFVLMCIAERVRWRDNLTVGNVSGQATDL